MRVSRTRGAAWLWLHLPVIGCILWVAEQLYYGLERRTDRIFCADDETLCLGYSYAWVRLCRPPLRTPHSPSPL